MLVVDPENPFWDSDRPWHQIPRAEQKCRRCYSDMHVQKECKLAHEFCQRPGCNLRNHHPVVCNSRRPGKNVASPVPEKEKKDASVNRGAASASKINSSWRETDAQKSGTIDGLRELVSDLKRQIIEGPTDKPEKAEWEKMYDRVKKTLTDAELEEHGAMLARAKIEGNTDQMQLILHRVIASRSGRPLSEFTARERAGGFVVIHLTWAEIMFRTCLWVAAYLCLLPRVWEHYKSSYMYLVPYEWIYDHPWNLFYIPSTYHLLLWFYIHTVPLQLLFLVLSNILLYKKPKISMSMFLVEHKFVVLPCPAGPEHDINNRHPVFRFGKTLEAAQPAMISHTVNLFVNGKSPAKWYLRWYHALMDGLAWKKFLRLRRPKGFQYEESYWVPVDNNQVYGVKNIQHHLRVRHGRITNLEDVLAPVGPNLDLAVIDQTRFDAISRIPNIAAAKTWDDMMRNVEVAVRTANWEAENWRAYDPEASMNLTNLCAYRWLSSVQSTRKVLRSDVQWSF